MINTIKEHLLRYPYMQIQDVAKLIYQSEFGGGHLIANAEQSLSRIQKEYDEMTFRSPAFEDIGNGMCRIYLSAIDQGFSAQALNQMFVQSANRKTGTIECLEQKLLLFEELPFPQDQVTSFLDTWKQHGYPAISHSDIYREHYHPAYRVMEIPSVIAIDGMSGSGKSTLGNALQHVFPNSRLFHMDDYFLQPHQRTPERLLEIGGNVDYERFHDEVILHLQDRSGIDYQVYDCHSQRLKPCIHQPFAQTTIIEGSYSLHPYFGMYYDYSIFCEISKEEQKTRILKRNGEWMWKRFESEWIPKENEYFKMICKQKGGL